MSGRDVVFVTARLQVRRLTMDDLPAFHAVWGDPRVIFWGASPDLEASRRKLADVIERRFDDADGSGWFAVERLGGGEFVGDVLVQSASWDPRCAEIGWHIAKRWQGRGYATDAATGLLAHAQSCGVSEVWAKILPDNTASQQVARRIGMTEVGSVDKAGRPHGLWWKALSGGSD